MEGEIDGFKYVAKWLAIVKSMDPMGRQAALNDPNAETRAPIEELENGIIEYFRPNENVHLMSNSWSKNMSIEVKTYHLTRFVSISAL
ncbi:MAG: hypothetical protein COA36_17665 [Desulfotalea sp.]|nr:MAG: hypothetical protein COA36_17665 [Desulfotalea sp.]